MANSQALTSLNIQLQDTLGTTSPVSILTRTVSLVAIATNGINGVVYSGYTPVVSIITTSLPAGAVYVYLRNATPNSSPNDNTNGISINVQGGGGGPIANLTLQPGGIFVYGNPQNVGAVSTLASVSYALQTAGKNLVLEYLVVT